MIGSSVAKALLADGRYKVYGLVRWRAKLSNLAGVIDMVHIVNDDTTGLVRMQ